MLWQRAKVVSIALFLASALLASIVFGSHVRPARGALREHQPIEVHGEPYVSSNDCWMTRIPLSVTSRTTRCVSWASTLRRSAMIS